MPRSLSFKRWHAHVIVETLTQKLTMCCCLVLSSSSNLEGCNTHMPALLLPSSAKIGGLRHMCRFSSTSPSPQDYLHHIISYPWSHVISDLYMYMCNLLYSVPRFHLKRSRCKHDPQKVKVYLQTRHRLRKQYQRPHAKSSRKPAPDARKAFKRQKHLAMPKQNHPTHIS